MQNQQQGGGQGLLGGMAPLMMMAAGASLLGAGGGGAGLGSIGSLISAMQRNRQLQAMQRQQALNNAFRQKQFGFQQSKWAQQLAQQQAQMALSRQSLGQQAAQHAARLGLDKQKFGLNQKQFGLTQRQHQNRLKAIEAYKALVGTSPNPEQNIAGTGLLGGQLTPQQFRLQSSGNFLAAGAPAQSLGLIDKALPAPAELKPTPLVSNLMAAGYKSGTPEMKAAIEKKLFKSQGADELTKGLIGADVAKLKRYDKLSEDAAENLSKIRQFRSAVNQFDTGLLSPGRLKLGQIDQALGGFFSDPKEVAMGEVIGTFTTEFILQFTQKTKGAISEPENKRFEEGSPGMMKTKEGNLKLSNIVESRNQRLFEKSNFMRSYLQANRNLAGAEKAWSRFVNENPIHDHDFNLNPANISNWQSYISPNYKRKPAVSGRASSSDPLGIR